ncbi:hypothetical protein AOZ07_06700 [Glutamicibacter halophytocola]|nr:hypothetical protein AOZ07_06700 [Glutamicibacter halophytocola]
MRWGHSAPGQVKANQGESQSLHALNYPQVPAAARPRLPGLPFLQNHGQAKIFAQRSHITGLVQFRIQRSEEPRDPIPGLSALPSWKMAISTSSMMDAPRASRWPERR